MSKAKMTYYEYLRRYSPEKWKRIQREQQRKPFETDEELDRRLFVAALVKKAMRIIRKRLSAGR